MAVEVFGTPPPSTDYESEEVQQWLKECLKKRSAKTVKAALETVSGKQAVETYYQFFCGGF